VRVSEVLDLGAARVVQGVRVRALRSACGQLAGAPRADQREHVLDTSPRRVGRGRAAATAMDRSSRRRWPRSGRGGGVIACTTP